MRSLSAAHSEVTGATQDQGQPQNQLKNQCMAVGILPCIGCAPGGYDVVVGLAYAAVLGATFTFFSSSVNALICVPGLMIACFPFFKKPSGPNKTTRATVVPVLSPPSLPLLDRSFNF